MEVPLEVSQHQQNHETQSFHIDANGGVEEKMFFPNQGIAAVYQLVMIIKVKNSGLISRIIEALIVN
jgi:hypothetical protein